MTRLELYQRGLLDLVKKRGVAPEDPYLRHVAESRALVVVREIAVWWRVFQIEAQCRFTSRLLTATPDVSTRLSRRISTATEPRRSSRN